MLRLSLPRGAAAVALLGLLVAFSGQLFAQPPNKKVLTFKDYDIWRSASGATLSRDGTYVAYLVGGDTGDGEAVVRHIASGKEFRFPRGSSGGTGAPGGFAALGTSPRFTPNGKQVLIPLTPTKAEIDKAKADKVKLEDYPKSSLAVVELPGGKIIERIQGVSSFQLGGEGAGFLVYRKQTTPAGKTESDKTETPPTKGGKFGKGGGKFPGPGGTGGGGPTTPTRTYGSDLFIRDLASGAERTIS